MEHTQKNFSCTVFIIKIVAYTTMLIDHIGAKIYLPYLTSIGQSYINNPTYEWMRHIGRLAFVLFAFMIAEGMDQTHNQKKYITRLAIFALISEFPYDLSRGNYFDSTSQNVYFTLLGGAIAIYLLKYIKSHFHSKWFSFLLVFISSLLIGILCYLIQSDYGAWGVLFIVLLYLTKENKVLMVLMGCLMLSIGYCSYRILVILFSYTNFEWDTLYTWLQINQSVFLPILTSELYGAPSLFLLYFYNGQKGKNISKKITYSFYPVHLLILGILRMILF